MLIPYINQRNGVNLITVHLFPAISAPEISAPKSRRLVGPSIGRNWKIHPIPWEPKAFMFSGALPHIFRAKKKHSQLFMVLGSKWFGSMCHENAYWR